MMWMLLALTALPTLYALVYKSPVERLQNFLHKIAKIDLNDETSVHVQRRQKLRQRGAQLMGRDGAPPIAAAGDALPADWVERSHGARAYYINTHTKQRTGNRPNADTAGPGTAVPDTAGPPSSQPQSTIDDPMKRQQVIWVPKFSQEHSQRFWENSKTGETTWVDPTATGAGTGGAPGELSPAKVHAKEAFNSFDDNSGSVSVSKPEVAMRHKPPSLATLTPPALKSLAHTLNTLESTAVPAALTSPLRRAGTPPRRAPSLATLAANKQTIQGDDAEAMLPTMLPIASTPDSPPEGAADPASRSLSGEHRHKPPSLATLTPPALKSLRSTNKFRPGLASIGLYLDKHVRELFEVIDTDRRRGSRHPRKDVRISGAAQ